ncbi:MAG: amino acid adenylation domain-containing protein [Rhodobacteraceae bacterium]|nr:amino acid adenylation domain-containing protein [Paracoccaceae bacterium]
MNTFTPIDQSNALTTALEPRSLLEHFHTRLSNTPESIVAESQSGKLTMRKLADGSAHIAHALLTLNVAPDDVVGIFAYPGFELLEGVWGVLRARAAYCPLSPDYPEERVRYMIEQSKMRVVICEAALANRLRKICSADLTILTSDDWHGNPVPPVSFQSPAPTDLAYVIFTSGSTGKPKGIMIEQESIANQMGWLNSSFNLGSKATILQKTPFSFDAAQWEILSSAFGARLIFGSADSYRSPEHQLQLVQSFGVTMLQGVPTLWRALVDSEKLGTCTSLEVMFSGGEPLSHQLAQDCQRACPQARMINLYGPSECTINASSYEVTPEAASMQGHIVPIGNPVWKTGFLILNEQGDPVSQGESGEIFIYGKQVARGYIGRKDLTSERFSVSSNGSRMYRTGDIGRLNPDGSIQYLSRIDGQIKLRGYRIELDEIRSAIENHDWVSAAGVFVNNNANTGSDMLVACVELSPNQAQLMDQSSAEEHHMSKTSKVQVKAQLSAAGCKAAEALRGFARLELPGANETDAQQKLAFGRKTYRHFEGSKQPKIEELQQILAQAPSPASGCDLREFTLEKLGVLLRNLGKFHSPERLLPKLAYASPGALYACQVYLEINEGVGVNSGVYYYHPIEHALYRVAECRLPKGEPFSVHFIGKNRAIEAVYKLNIREVLDFETGHILGLLDGVLPEYGLALSGVNQWENLLGIVSNDADDHYVGGFSISGKSGSTWLKPEVSAYLQTVGGKVKGIGAGFYEVKETVRKVSDDIIERRHVIAINQKVYDQASFGISFCVDDEEPLAYVALGRVLQRLQMNIAGYGFMSSGYSSKSGHDLGSATRLADILGKRPGASYFCVGGRISDEQYSHRGMKEDSIHTKGPAELILEDLKATLPAFMIPNKVRLVRMLPLLPNGKGDIKALKQRYNEEEARTTKDHVAPRNDIEKEIATQWGKVLKCEQPSVNDDFFHVGGDSLSAVGMISLLNETFDLKLPLETVFEATTISALAKHIAALNTGARPSKERSRLVALNQGKGQPILCWPGLGGYPMNLRQLAGRLGSTGRPVFGMQAVGLNSDEHPALSVREMGLLDKEEILQIQPNGPYTLVGYSFGARVAFETAHWLEANGKTVDNLILIAPGNPIVDVNIDPSIKEIPSFRNPAYVAVLLSVFTQCIDPAVLKRSMPNFDDAESFAAFVSQIKPNIDREVVSRIAEVARLCYDATYRFEELHERKINAPITVFNAIGDNSSFIESCSAYAVNSPRITKLNADHYGLLKAGGVDILADQILDLLDNITGTQQAA